jgi:ADP-ribosylation factor-like protein 2
LVTFFFLFQRLAGATLLVFSNKQDLPGALLAEEIKDVSFLLNETC